MQRKAIFHFLFNFWWIVLSVSKIFQHLHSIIKFGYNSCIKLFNYNSVELWKLNFVNENTIKNSQNFFLDLQLSNLTFSKNIIARAIDLFFENWKGYLSKFSRKKKWSKNTSSFFNCYCKIVCYWKNTKFVMKISLYYKHYTCITLVYSSYVY